MRGAFIKGAPEVIIERCSKIKGADGDEPLSADDRAGMLEASAAIRWASSR
jgi:magnesium-transporting ATPase (P-type)